MPKWTFLFVGLVCWALSIGAESGADGPSVVSFDPATFVAIRQRLQAGDASLKPALEALVEDADKALKVPPASVMDKAQPFPGADKHDYVSYAPYFWPNPDTPSGLPYVRHDGKRNREQTAKGDAPRFQRTVGAVSTLGLAYGYTGREPYAEHAVELLRAWFLDPATRMNPNFTHAQAVLGENSGRGTGLIEFAGMPRLLDALGLLRGSPAWTAEDRKGMDAWLAEYAHWLATSKEAADERNAKNNHGTWFDVHEASLLLYLGKTDEARAVCERAKTKRIAVQIEPDGRMPLELARADGWGYSTFNARALTELATLAQRVDVDLWHHETADGRSIPRALDYLAAYTDPEKKWPHNQMNNFNRGAILPALLRGQVAYGEAAYAEALGRLPGEAVARERTRLSTEMHE
jgi:hypothetical protein